MIRNKRFWIWGCLILLLLAASACQYTYSPDDYDEAQDIVDEWIEESKATPTPEPTPSPPPREGLFFSDAFKEKILTLNPIEGFDPQQLTENYVIYADNYPGDNMYVITYIIKPDLTLEEIGDMVGVPIFGQPIGGMSHADTLNAAGGSGEIQANVNISEGDEGYTVIVQFLQDGSLQLIVDINGAYKLPGIETAAPELETAEIYYQGIRYNPVSGVSRVSTVWQMETGQPAAVFERCQSQYGLQPGYAETEFVGKFATRMGFFTAVDDGNPKAPVEIEIDDERGMLKMGVGVMDF